MKSNLRVVMPAALVLAFAVTAMPAMSAVKKTPAKKPTTNRAVLGTKQLNGDQAQLGVTYTLGKKAPINVTLDKVEYTVEPVRFGNNAIVPKADQKFMVLHYTLHNCMPATRGLGWSTLEITAVDANDTNWRFAADVAMEATGELCRMSLKPAQKTKVYTVIAVPAKGEIPKIMLQSSDKLVLRYDVRGKVAKLPAPIADPADPTGATALEKVPAEMGVYYPIRDLHGRIDSAEFSTEPFQEKAPKKGTRYFIVKGTAKNNQPGKYGFSWSTFRPKLVDADGGEVRGGDGTYFASRDDAARGEIEPGQEFRFRWVFTVPEKVQLQSLSVTQGNGRAFVYDVSQIK